MLNEFNSEPLANMLYEAYNKSSNGPYLMEKVKKRFYGKIVKDHVPIMKELHAFLVDNKHTVKNPYIYGDADVAVWYEKSPETVTDIVVVKSCSAADDNTHIFIIRDWTDFCGTEDVKFLAVTAWPRQKKRSGYKYGDYRDIEYPSIH